jgi:hypothetical protein
MRHAPFLALLLFACSSLPCDGLQPAPDSAEQTALPKASFATRLLKIAADYKPDEQSPFIRALGDGITRGWTRLGDVPAWAPTLCMAPPPPAPLVSDSRDAGSHGKKLYFLHARDVPAYRTADSVDQPVGQAFVKESYEAIAVQEADSAFREASYEGLATDPFAIRQVSLGPA